LFVFIPDKSELVVFNVDEDKRLGPWNNELLVSVVFFVDKSEFVVDNNEDAVDGFFESAIFLIAQYCIILVNISKNEMWERELHEYLNENFSCNIELG
jgi:hypothetical protein